MPRGRRAGRPTRGRPQKKEESPNEAGVADVFQDLIAEAATISQASASEDGRPIKKRRVGGRLVVSGGPNELGDSRSQNGAVQGLVTPSEDVERESSSVRQTIYNESDGSEDSEDADWQDVTLAITAETAESMQREPLGDVQDLTLDLQADQIGLDTSSTNRRKPLTAAERKLRLEVHKMHVLTFLSHVHLRNHWCNDLDIQVALKKLLSASTIKYLEDDERETQFQRSRSLTDGLEKASEVFRQHFEISARGLKRGFWSEDQEQLAEHPIPEDTDLPVRKEDFRDISKKLSGSRDVGAQLFCAMLRSVHLDARLVCSLQPLPFASTSKAFSTPSKPMPTFTVAYPETRTGMAENASDSEERNDSRDRYASPDPKNYTSPNAVPKPVHRFGRTAYGSKPPPKPKIVTPPPKPKKKRTKESPYPVFWVEVFNPATVKWIPVDPLVTKSIGKPTKFEPPANDGDNSMSYVIAFEEDGYAKDVTRRYAKAYNAKTRRSRVDCTKGGENWWKRVVRMYHTSYQLDRDQIENAELATKEAQEPMPKNIQEFKNHPYYALERHLRRNEVLHPKRSAGKVSAGTNKPLEPIYRRKDVHVVKSQDGWFRLGREVIRGEEPLKILEPSRRKGGRDNLFNNASDNPFVDEDRADGRPGQPMYAAFQTQAYIPPPISDGCVPRNMYGNIDVYTATMVPPGGVWVAHPFAAGAAKLLGIDYADAVTGFEFKGRTGTAVIKGVVIAAEFYEALIESIQGLQYAFEEEENTRRAETALRGWKRFLVGLRIRERIVGYENDTEKHKQDTEREDDDEESDDEDGGGFFPDRDMDSGSDMPEPKLDLEPIKDLEVDDAPISKALRDAREEIITTWGKPPPQERQPEPPTPIGYQAHSESELGAGGFPPGGVANDVGAGGFIVEEAETSGGYDGGKFLPEDNVSVLEKETPGGDFEVEAQEVLPNNAAHTNPRQLEAEQLHDNDKQDLQQSLVTEFEAGSQNSGQGGEDQEAASASYHNDEEPQEDEEVEDVGEVQVADKDETGSLLSHDPEDEDATPEWLA